MAIAVGQTITPSGGFGTSRTYAFSSAPAATDLIVIGVNLDSSASITVPSGFTSTEYIQSDNNQRQLIAWKYNDTSNSYTFSWTGSTVHQGTGFTFTGVDSSTPIEAQSASWSQSSFSALTVSSITTLTNNAWNLIVGFNSAGITAASLTDYTVQSEAQRFAWFTRDIAVAGATGAKTPDLGTEFYTSGYSLAIKPTGAAVTVKKLAALGVG